MVPFDDLPEVVRFHPMSAELIAILAVGAALATLLLTGLRRVEARIDRVEARIDRVETSLTTRMERIEAGQTELRERMAHLEGLLEGLREAIAHNRAA